MSRIRHAIPEERAAVGKRIDSSTAEVFFLYGKVLDPYDELPEFAEDNVGRQWFADDPVELISVHFYDLPEATVHGLEAKRQEADRQVGRQSTSERSSASER